MKCKKCNDSLIISPFNNLTGYNDYRCSACNSLFDLEELKNNINATNDNLLLKEIVKTLEKDIGSKTYISSNQKCLESLAKYTHKFNKCLSDDIIFDKNILDAISQKPKPFRKSFVSLPSNFNFDSLNEFVTYCALSFLKNQPRIKAILPFFINKQQLELDDLHNTFLKDTYGIFLYRTVLYNYIERISIPTLHKNEILRLFFAILKNERYAFDHFKDKLIKSNISRNKLDLMEEAYNFGKCCMPKALALTVAGVEYVNIYFENHPI